MSSRLDWIQDWDGLAADAKYQPRQLAQTCQISERQLCRFILGKFGRTTGRWLFEVRMQKAPLLLLTKQTSKMTAFELGFKQPSHFCREFKRVYGMSPRTYILLSNTLQQSGWEKCC